MRYQRLNLKFYLRVSDKKKEHYPVYFRIIIAGKPFPHRLSFYIPLEFWDETKQRAVITYPYAHVVNAAIQEVESKISECYHRAMGCGIPFTADFVFQQLYGHNYAEPVDKSLANPEEMDFYKFSREVIESRRKEWSYQYYRQMAAELTKLEKFRPKIKVKDWNYNLVKSYESYMRSELNNKGNTVIKTFKKIKVLLRDARLKGLLQADPFEGHTIRGNKPKDIVHLEPDEIKRLIEFPFMSQSLSITRDIFLLQIYTGFSFGDLTTLSLENFYTGPDSHTYIYKERNKTGQQSVLPLFEAAQKILTKFGLYENGHIKDHLYSLSKYNLYLKHVAELVGINKQLSSHVARKTFGMILLNEGVSQEAVSRMLGHSNIKITQRHYTRVQDRLIHKEVQKASFFAGL